jgi:uncharacterized membrane protein YcaP (DUF421 family)
METVIRVAIVYVFVLVGLRLLGKREFSQLSPMELVTLLLIPEIVSQSLVREDFSIVNGLVGVSTLLVLVFLTSLLAQQSRGFQKAIESSPTVLVHEGRIFADNLNRERVTPDEIFAQLRRAGLERLEQVKWAILESDGKLSIVPMEGGGKPAPDEVEVLA